MIGITGYSVYVPQFRIRRETIAATWGSTPDPDCKPVRDYDEDSLTMGQTAAWRLLESSPAIRGLA
jgi:3-hydroxy-3-methylglutaryl CoA synthase